MAMAIAQIELRIGLRNSWVLLATAMLMAFSVVLVLLGSKPGGETSAHLLTVTTASLSALAVYLIPLIALLLSFDAIAGEIERGTLQLMFATPVSRWQIVAGKFLGHLAVMSIAITCGYLVAALIAIALDGVPGASAVAGLIRLIITSILLGAVFIAIGYCVSSLTRQSGTAAALAIGMWLVSVVLYDLALLGGLLISGDGVFTRHVFPWLLLANPADAFRLYNMAQIDDTVLKSGLGSGSSGLALPDTAILLSPVLALAIAFTLAVVLIRRVDP